LNACKSGPQNKNSSPAEESQSLSFETHREQEVLLLYPEKAEESPRLILTLDLPDLAGPLGVFIQSLLYKGLSPAEYKEGLISFYGNQYNKVAASSVELLESLNWEYTETLDARFLSPRLLVICQSWEYYLGGAHGMREKKYFVVDTDKIEQITLEMLLNDASSLVLKQLIEDELRKLSEIDKQAPLSSGGFFEDTVEIPQNFFLSSKDLSFHWDPYEIAPYVKGPIEVAIPYTAIRDILSASGKSIISDIGK
jgi:hypothetical protein